MHYLTDSYKSEYCILLDYYAASSGNLSPTFRDKLSFPSSRVKNPGEYGY